MSARCLQSGLREGRAKAALMIRLSPRNRNPAAPAATRTPALSPDLFARGLLLLVAAVICAITWRKWGSLTVDCGREMYIPAILSQGKRLYFDAWYMYGPLIPYWHAALFRLLGIHLGVLIAAGVSLVAIVAMLLYSVSRVFLPVSLSFACVFVFLLQAFQLNIYNYVLPYSYPAAYGSMFIVLLLWLLLRRGSEFGWRYVVLLGFVASLMTLTKLEFGVAGYAGIACALVVRSIRERSLRGLGVGVCACIPGAALWLGIYGWYVHAGGASFFLGENLSILPDSHFVKHFGKLWNERIGLVLTPWALARSAAIGLAGFATLAASVVLAVRSRKLRWVFPAMAVAICGVHVVATSAPSVFHGDIPSLVFHLVPFLFFNPGMIWVCLAVLAMAVADWWRGDRPARQQSVIVLCAMAIACGVRVLTRIMPSGYSTFLGTLVYLVWLLGLFRVSKRFSANLDGRAGKIVAGVLCVSMMALMVNYYPVGRQSYRVSSPRGTLFVSPSAGKAYSQVLAFMEHARRSSQGVVVMPEDTALYYLGETVAPSRWYIVTGQVLPPGEATARYVEELDRANIRYVIVSDRATPEYGIPLFGVDYGLPISAWLAKNYRIVRQIGDYQAVAYPKEWGVLIYERKGCASPL